MNMRFNFFRNSANQRPNSRYNRKPGANPVNATASAEVLDAIHNVVQQHYVNANAQAFSIKTFCDTWGISRQLAYKEINAGRLAAVKVGRRTLIRRSDAQRWIAAAKTIGA
jgi:excisionase family DNA binding protein